MSTTRELTRITECPLCGADADSGKLIHNQVDLVVCECKLVYQQMYMTQKENEEFYKNEYRLAVPPYKKDMDAINIIQEENRGKKNNDVLIDFGIEPKKHLDVGSSSGYFSMMLKDTYGCASIGVEPYDLFREFSISQGVNTVEDISEVNGKFDLITIVHVLEHLLNPLEMLSNIANLLEDDGHLFVEVPFMMLCLSHPLLFHGTTLKKMLNKANFEILRLELRDNKDIWAMATHSN